MHIYIYIYTYIICVYSRADYYTVINEATKFVPIFSVKLYGNGRALHYAYRSYVVYNWRASNALSRMRKRL